MSKGVFLLPLLLCVFFVHNVVSDSHFLNEWAAEIKGGYEHAKRVAEDHGYELVGQLIGFKDHYDLRHKDVPHRSKRSADHHTTRLTADSRVLWAEQQVAKQRSKRGYLEERSSEDRIYRTVDTKINDPWFNKQWYLHDLRQNPDEENKKDLHVIPLWNRNLTGKGIVVTILDDGIERNHSDLIANYDPDASYDLNGGDADPMPRYDPTNENKHGTRCAGEVAMMANNNICGTGVAFNAKIGGIRMLDGTVTDKLEGQALSYNAEHIDIYSASWGPNDDGHTVEGPGPLARKAFETGIRTGRGGKGVLYVWASGNGGRLEDNCDCDGYTGSRYTISISSASQEFKKPWYGERCASTMATTYSSGTSHDMKVVSTDLHNKCTNLHTGTSAAAPLAAGIFALLLEANPSVTWRDVQHLVAWTSQVAPLTDNPGWVMNAAGFWVNTAFGMGLMDATGLVDAADPKTWQSVPQEYECTVSAKSSTTFPKTLTAKKHGNMLEVDIYSSGCEDQTNEIHYLEHVILNITVNYSRRGDLVLSMTSPSNTTVVLLSKREFDSSKLGYQFWPLMSVHTWGENPKGTWKIHFKDESGRDNTGAVIDIKLTMFGTKDKPHHMRNGPRKYNLNYNDVTNDKKEEEAIEHSGYLDSLMKKLKTDLLLSYLS